MKRRGALWEPSFIKRLKDPEYAALYLTLELEEGDMEFLLIALRDIIKANGGMTRIARKAKRHRVSLYKMLSKNGNPELESFLAILDALNMTIKIKSKKNPKRKIYIRKKTIKRSMRLAA